VVGPECPTNCKICWDDKGKPRCINDCKDGYYYENGRCNGELLLSDIRPTHIYGAELNAVICT